MCIRPGLDIDAWAQFGRFLSPGLFFKIKMLLPSPIRKTRQNVQSIQFTASIPRHASHPRHLSLWHSVYRYTIKTQSCNARLTFPLHNIMVDPRSSFTWFCRDSFILLRSSVALGSISPKRPTSSSRPSSSTWKQPATPLYAGTASSFFSWSLHWIKNHFLSVIYFSTL
jgi:hypothetical protein